MSYPFVQIAVLRPAKTDVFVGFLFSTVSETRANNMSDANQKMSTLVHCKACRGVLLIVHKLHTDNRSYIHMDIRCPHCKTDWTCQVKHSDETTITLIEKEG